MMKSEKEFLKLLEKKAREDSRIVKSGILPKWVSFLAGWLGINPWRVMIPVSVMFYLVLRIIIGETLVEAVLAVYGGYRGSI